MEFDIQVFDILKVAIAIFLGGLIGLERELVDKPAELRTHMLVILGDTIVAKFGNSPYLKTINADPIRIIEAIVTGISFLGAGTIILKSQQETIEGLTTAASILFASAIGIAVALDAVGLAISLTILVLVILFGLGFVEEKIHKLKSFIRGSDQ